MKGFLSPLAGLWGEKRQNMGAKDKFTANMTTQDEFII